MSAPGSSPGVMEYVLQNERAGGVFGDEEKRMEDFKFDGDPLVATLLEPDIQEVRMAIQRLESQVL